MAQDKDISREDLMTWVKLHARGILSAYGVLGGGFHPFVYTKASADGHAVDVVLWQKDAADRRVCFIAIPPRGRRNETVLLALQTRLRAEDQWWRPHVPPGRSFPVRQTKAFPKGPQEGYTLFYVLRHADSGRLATWPGCDAVRTFATRPEAYAAKDYLDRESGYHAVVCVTEETTLDEWQATVLGTILEKRGEWYYQKTAGDKEITPAEQI